MSAVGYLLSFGCVRKTNKGHIEIGKIRKYALMSHYNQISV